MGRKRKKSKRGGAKHRARQRELRGRRNERAYLFDKDVLRCLAEVDREDWEIAIDLAGGEVSAAARICGLQDVPTSAKALWGSSAESAAAVYRKWKRDRG